MLCWEQRTLSSLSAGHRVERQCCLAAFPTRHLYFSWHEDVALVERPCVQLAPLKAAAAARALSGLKLPREQPCPCKAVAATTTAGYSALPAPPHLPGSGPGPCARGESIHALPATDLQALLVFSWASCPPAWTVPSEGRFEWPLLPRRTRTSQGEFPLLCPHSLPRGKSTRRKERSSGLFQQRGCLCVLDRHMLRGLLSTQPLLGL